MGQISIRRYSLVEYTRKGKTVKDIQITGGVVYETWDDGTTYISPIEAYGAEEAGKAKKFILDQLLDTNNHPSFEEKDRLVECLRTMNKIIEKEINCAACNSVI